MRRYRVILNLCLALVCGLALAAAEGRLALLQAERSPVSEVQAKVRAHLGRGPAGGGLVSLVGRNLPRQTILRVVRSRYDTYINQTAARYGVPPALVKAVIHAESGFDPNAVSPVGAVGLMQLMPDTATLVGAQDPFDPKQNIRAGVKYLKYLLVMFNGDKALAVAAYNTGPGKVQKYGGVPPYKETQVFVNRVMTFYQAYLDS